LHESHAAPNHPKKAPGRCTLNSPSPDWHSRPPIKLKTKHRPKAAARLMQQFFIGLHHPSTAWPFLHSMISLNNLRDRKRAFNVNCWVLDSGGYTELSAYGKWRMEPQQYADQINQLKQNGILLAAVSQDFMCTPQILAKTGSTSTITKP
jgi:hypothetical protein